MNHIRRKLNIIGLSVLCTPLMASICFADQFTENFTVKTRIERNEFFSSQIKAEFTEPVLYPAYDEETDTLMPIRSQLIVTATNVVETDAGVGHLLTLYENQTQCFEHADEVDETEIGQGLKLIPTDTDNYGENFVRIFIDGTTNDDELSKIQSLTFPFDEDEDTEDGELKATHDVLLNFGQIPENAIRCEGDISLLVEFDL